MTCPHKKNGRCGVAEQISKLPCKPDEDQCLACTLHYSSQRINGITVGLAISSIENTGLEPPDHLYAIIRGEQQFGPGTHLKILLEEQKTKYWFLCWNPNYFKMCNCEDWITHMDEWGVDGCIRNLPRILNHLAEDSAKAYPILRLVPFSLRLRYFSNLLLQAFYNASGL